MKPLADFFRAYMRGAMPLRPPADSVRMLANSTEVVLHREGAFQVELITLRAGSVIPSHAHPNVDSYELALSASADMEVNVGRRRYGANHAPIMPIARGVPHGAKPGSSDMAFLSFQHWHGAEPSFITDDWSGPEWN